MTRITSAADQYVGARRLAQARPTASAASSTLARLLAGRGMASVDELRHLDYTENGDDKRLAVGKVQTPERVAAFAPVAQPGGGRLLGIQGAPWTELVPNARAREYRMFP